MHLVHMLVRVVLVVSCGDERDEMLCVRALGNYIQTRCDESEGVGEMARTSELDGCYKSTREKWDEMDCFLRFAGKNLT